MLRGLIRGGGIIEFRGEKRRGTLERYSEVTEPIKKTFIHVLGPPLFQGPKLNRPFLGHFWAILGQFFAPRNVDSILGA